MSIDDSPKENTMGELNWKCPNFCVNGIKKISSLLLLPCVNTSCELRFSKEILRTTTQQPGKRYGKPQKLWMICLVKTESSLKRDPSEIRRIPIRERVLQSHQSQNRFPNRHSI